MNSNGKKSKKARAGAVTATVTVATFDRRHATPVYRAIRKDQPISAWRPIGPADYMPSGTTPLLDATSAFIADLARLRAKGKVVIGALADESGSMLDNRDAVIGGINEFVASMAGVAVDPKADGRVLAVILTDGLENASQEVTASQVRRMIAEREAEGWTFIYMGANQDAWAAGGALGVSGSASGQRVNYVGTAEGTRSALRESARRAVHYLSDTVDFHAVAASAPDSELTEDGELVSPAVPAPERT